ncbi:MAG: hypothetical protein NTU90_08795, partial [Proteobacteria bacterium]|nr:hypothetical protein [Pseudomonadota bacterium]
PFNYYLIRSNSQTTIIDNKVYDIFKIMDIINKYYFGKYKDESLEWLFFHDPAYVLWIVKENIHQDKFKFTNEARNRFEELMKRASHLRIPGLRKWCKSRPISRMFYTFDMRGKVVGIHFDCDVCRPDGSSFSLPHTPSFFPPFSEMNFDKTAYRLLLDSIRQVYFGSTSVKLTQGRLEEFFNNQQNFVDF